MLQRAVANGEVSRQTAPEYKQIKPAREQALHAAIADRSGARNDLALACGMNSMHVRFHDADAYHHTYNESCHDLCTSNAYTLDDI